MIEHIRRFDYGAWLFRLLPVAALACMSGCGSRSGERAYRDVERGFSFAPPSGWSQRSNAEAVTSATGNEKLLVQYKRLMAGNPAWLHVAVIDDASSLPINAWLGRYLDGRSLGRGRAVEVAEFAGKPAAISAGTVRWKKSELASEVIGIRHANQVYVFTAYYPLGDEKAHSDLHQAVASASWRDAPVQAGR